MQHVPWVQPGLIDARTAAPGAAATTCACTQSILAEGGYHPSINETMVERVNVPYSPQSYPPPYLQAQGYRCSCGQFFDNACRSSFRKVA